MAVTIAKVTAKLGVVGGAVYFTAREGLWGTSSETNEAYRRLKSKTLDEWLPGSVEKPTATKKIVSKSLTQKKEETSSVKPQQPSQYNACVNTVFKTLADIPETVPQKFNSAMGYFRELSG